MKRVSVSNIVIVLLENGEKMEQPVRDICSLPPGGGDPHWPGWPVSRVEEEEKKQLRQERRERELRMERRRKMNNQVKEIQNVYNLVEESEYMEGGAAQHREIDFSQGLPVRGSDRFR